MGCIIITDYLPDRIGNKKNNKIYNNIKHSVGLY
jgi:hypothetical protein